MESDDDQWIENFVVNATKAELQTLLYFIEANAYSDELINQLKLKIEEAP
jgi:hypothetical protein